jgi:hypothetical protein
LPKCDFALSELRYLGHLVSGARVKFDPKKVAALDKWVAPQSIVSETASPTILEQAQKSHRKQLIKKVRRFLGFIQYFGHFIPRFRNLASIIYDQTKDDAPPWTEVCTTTRNLLRMCLQLATLMHHPDFKFPFHVYFDASLRGVGGVLMQERASLMYPTA